jgi:hypothetical protein
MSIKDLQKEIRQKEGIIFSEATLKNEHLLTSAYDLMVAYNMRTPLKQDIEKVFSNTDKEDEEKLLPTYTNQFYSRITIPENKQEEAGYIWEEVFDYFNNICPANYFFGATDGDGACFGFFKYDITEY